MIGRYWSLIGFYELKLTYCWLFKVHRVCCDTHVAGGWPLLRPHAGHPALADQHHEDDVQGGGQSSQRRQSSSGARSGSHWLVDIPVSSQERVVGWAHGGTGRAPAWIIGRDLQTDHETDDLRPQQDDDRGRCLHHCWFCEHQREVHGWHQRHGDCCWMLAASVQVRNIFSEKYSIKYLIKYLSSVPLLRTEMSTCSGCLSGLNTWGPGRKDSDSQQHWTALPESRRCVGTWLRKYLIQSEPKIFQGSTGRVTTLKSMECSNRIFHQVNFSSTQWRFVSKTLYLELAEKIFHYSWFRLILTEKLRILTDSRASPTMPRQQRFLDQNPPSSQRRLLLKIGINWIFFLHLVPSTVWFTVFMYFSMS